MAKIPNLGMDLVFFRRVPQWGGGGGGGGGGDHPFFMLLLVEGEEKECLPKFGDTNFHPSS